MRQDISDLLPVQFGELEYYRWSWKTASGGAFSAFTEARREIFSSQAHPVQHLPRDLYGLIRRKSVASK